MTLLNALIEKLTGLKESSDFSLAVTELQNSLTALDGAALELSTALENALFESPEQAQQIRSEIATNNEQRETLRAAIAGAEKRLASALAHERTIAAEQRSAEAKDIQRRLHRNYLVIHKSMTTLKSLFDEVSDGELKLTALNQFASDQGRPDLRQTSPYDLLMSICGRNHGYGNPLKTLLVGYMQPSIAPGEQPVLARMHEVKI